MCQGLTWTAARRWGHGSFIYFIRNIARMSFFICFTVCTEDISKIGNAFEGPNILPFENTVFLITVPAVQRPGVLFAYRAYIADENAMLVLQLWRPVRSSNQTGSENRLYELIDDLYFSPTARGQVDVSYTSARYS